MQSPCGDPAAGDAGPPVGYWAFLRDQDGHTSEVSFGQDVGLVVDRARRVTRPPQRPPSTDSFRRPNNGSRLNENAIFSNSGSSRISPSS